LTFGAQTQREFLVPSTGDLATFEFNGAVVSTTDVLCAAQFRNELQPLLARLEWQADCEGEASRLGLEIEEDVIEQKINQFRFDRDLISAEDTEAWLSARGLSTEGLEGYFIRCHWWEVLRERVSADRTDAGAIDLGRIEAVAPDLLLSGSFGPLATEHSRRLVARHTWGQGGNALDLEGERGRFLVRFGMNAEGLGDWLGALRRNEEWFQEMLAMEGSYRAVCDSVSTPEKLARALVTLRLPLTRLEVETAEFDSEDAAREALICVRDDGLSLEEVAREAGYPCEQIDLLAEDLPEAERQELLFAGIGEPRGPAASGGVFRVRRVLRRSEPTLDDARVKGRVVRRILDSHFSEAAGSKIRWLFW
jgi:hypothetical protein